MTLDARHHGRHDAGFKLLAKGITAVIGKSAAAFVTLTIHTIMHRA